MDEAQRALLESVLRRLHVALKTVRLYSSAHAVSQSVLPDLTAAVQEYLTQHGPLIAQVGKDRLEIEDRVLNENGLDALAFFLHVRSVAVLGLEPGVTSAELGRLLGVLSLDRQALEEAGGVDRAAGELPHVIIKSVMLADVDGKAREAEMIFALTRGSVLAPDQQDAVLEIVRGGPEAVAALVQRIYEHVGANGDGVEAVTAALETLDRTILDQPVEDQDLLYRNLAQAQLLVEEPLRSRLTLALLPQVADGGAARTVAAELTSDEIVRLVLTSEDRAAMAAQIVSLLDGLMFEKEKASAVATALRAALANQGVQVEISPAAGQELRADLPEKDGWNTVPQALIEIGVDDERWLGTLSTSLTERALKKDAARTLINLLYAEDDPEQTGESARTLGPLLPALAADGEFETVATALEALRHTAARGDAFAEPAHAEIARALDHGVLDALLDHLFLERHLPTGVRDSLVAARRGAVPRLMDLLEREPQAARRRRLCEVLVEIASGEPVLLGARLPSATWHLSRNLAFVLGELRDPAVVSYLVGLSRHTEYRVRREVIDALRKIGTEESRAALAGFFADPDPRIQHHLIEGVESRDGAVVAAWLLTVVRSPDFTPRGVSLKTAAIRAVVRMRPPEALAVLERLARARWVFGRQRKAVRAAAREALAAWREGGA